MITINYLQMMHKLPVAPVALFWFIFLYYSDCQQPRIIRSIRFAHQGGKNNYNTFPVLSFLFFFFSSDELWLVPLLIHENSAFLINSQQCQHSDPQNVSAELFQTEMFGNSPRWFPHSKTKTKTICIMR